MRPPRSRTWGRRGITPVIRVRGGGTGRVSVAGLACYRPGDRSRLIYRLHCYRGRKGETKAFTWTEYRDLLIAAHRQLPGGNVVLVWDNLNVHLGAELRAFTGAQAWLRVFRLPAYAPDLNPVEMSLPQCELRRSPLPWLPGSLSFEVSSIGVPSSVQRRRLWYPAGSWCRARRRSTSAWSAVMIHR